MYSFNLSSTYPTLQPFDPIYNSLYRGKQFVFPRPLQGKYRGKQFVFPLQGKYRGKQFIFPLQGKYRGKQFVFPLQGKNILEDL